MTAKKRYILLVYLPLFMLCVSPWYACVDDYSKINTNPNQATPDMVQEDNLATGSFFVQMQKNVIPIAQPPDFGDEMYQIVQNLTGDIYSGYMGATGSWFSGANNATYALIAGWCGAAYDRAFLNVLPSWSFIKKSAEKKSPQVLAVATIVKIVSLHRTTDMYGPLPYKSFGNGKLQNQFDSQKDIYYSFFDELNEAIAVLTDFQSKNQTATIMPDYDFIYSGDVRKWIMFANSLKLRLAIRLAYADPEKAKQEAESAVSHAVGVLMAPSDGAELKHMPKLIYNHPLYIICYHFQDVRMGAMMDSYLNGYKDPRLLHYFNKTKDGTYRGVRNGISLTNASDYSLGKFSTLNVTPAFPVIWMHAAEVYFLRAEGALRGWNMNGTAQSLYESGVKTSFTYWGASGYDDYIKNATNLPADYTDVAHDENNAIASSTIPILWDDTATTEVNLERIITQKWIAMYPDGQEAWSEFRRTGYPKVFPVVVNLSGGTINTDVQIRRLPFPQSIYTNNSGGVAQAVSLLGGDDNGGTKLWWDKK